VEVHARFTLCFNHTHETIETLEPVEFLRMTELRCIERVAEKSQRLIVRLQRHRMRMAVFPAMCERKPRWILKATRRTVNDFSNECERLECAWPELLE